MDYEESQALIKSIHPFLLETCCVCLGFMEIDYFTGNTVIYSCRDWSCKFDAISIENGKIHWHPMPTGNLHLEPMYGAQESLDALLRKIL